MEILTHSPGERVTVVLETLNTDGYRDDGYSIPSIVQIIFPDLSLASGYPQNMVSLGTGLFYYQFTLPTGSTAIGSYLVDIIHYTTETDYKNYLYQVIVNARSGNFSVSPG